ncbi:MAG: ACT domain-containing protein [Dehalococcoidia bacterium]|nr:ACT domain-containing protein [Dehalococcoidia bacterium]MXZ87258.1 ACT domain-containing protein [Dehalococcoidia bacterium]MYI85358.1 ACT domain-containing protein [Dehalococcoidia bacterium]
MKRITVATQNRVGVIAGITETLAGADVNLVAINTERTGETGLVTLSTEEGDHDRALQCLVEAGYRAVTDEALLIRLKDEPGALAKVAARFRDAGINIQSLHILDRHEGYATVALDTEDREATAALLSPDEVV